MRFTKMHGIGNDYVYIDARQQSGIDLARAARLVSDRHVAVGSDGLIAVCAPSRADADVRMRMFNADGSEGEMCGNGIRCVAKFAVDRGIAQANPLRVETGRGVLEVFVSHSALVQEMGFHKRQTLLRLAELLPDEGITDIRCRLLPDAVPPAGGTADV